MTIVYTAILGSCDSLKPAPAGADRCVCFTDDPAHVVDPNGWEIEFWPFEEWHEQDPRREAWRLRSLPHELFEGYTSVVWIDASFTLIDLPRLLRDSAGHELAGLRHHARGSCFDEGTELIKIGQSDRELVAGQLLRYVASGFKPASLTISCVLVRANTPKVNAFNAAWDMEISTHRGDNTQLSIDYCAWKNGIAWHHLAGVRKDNPYAQHDHADHKRRRKPYR